MVGGVATLLGDGVGMIGFDSDPELRGNSETAELDVNVLTGTGIAVSAGTEVGGGRIIGLDAVTMVTLDVRGGTGGGGMFVVKLALYMDGDRDVPTESVDAVTVALTAPGAASKDTIPAGVVFTDVILLALSEVLLFTGL